MFRCTYACFGAGTRVQFYNNNNNDSHILQFLSKDVKINKSQAIILVLFLYECENLSP
jgi:hypothetical protein